MTTIILTIIGILLAAAAALMVIFYGGDAFNSGSVGAQANTYQNAGTNVIAGYQLARANDAVFSMADTQYLKEKPALPNGATGSFVQEGTVALYEVTGVDAAVCKRVNKNLRRVAAGSDGTLAGKAGKMGCDTSSNVFYASLGSPDSVTPIAAAGGGTPGDLS